jgi:hypothetical protein
VICGSTRLIMGLMTSDRATTNSGRGGLLNAVSPYCNRLSREALERALGLHCLARLMHMNFLQSSINLFIDACAFQ